MLRITPTKINLTAADLADLDGRILARRRAGLDVQRTSARLSVGPRLKTAIATSNSATRNGKQRAVSTGSEATLHNLDMMGDSCSPLHTAPTETMSAVRPKPTSSAEEGPGQSNEAPQTEHSIPLIDGTDDLRDTGHMQRSNAQTAVTPCRPGRQALQELPFEAAGSPAVTHKLLASTRARRPMTRSHDDPIVIREDSTADRALDPSATIFTPRVRFGSTITFTDVNSPAGRIHVGRERRDEEHSAVGLTTRSSSEQNFKPRNNSEALVAADRGDVRLIAAHSNVDSSVRNRHSNDSICLPSPHLERYPLLLPSALPSSRRRSGDLQTAYTPTRQLPTIPSSPIDSTETSPVTVIQRTPTDDSSSLLSVRSAHTPRDRMVSAASGISDDESPPCKSITSRRSSPEIADAATEFLRFRSSPLDNLTEELSRLSATLTSQSTKKDLSRARTADLLNGDPFRKSGSQSLTIESNKSSFNATISTPTTTPAPKITIYNDATASHVQPQTLAGGMQRSARRSRNRSDPAVQNPFNSNDHMSPATSSTRSGYRNTHPPVGARLWENDVEDSLVGLEEEMSHWVEKVEGRGGLETTPPEVGRWERLMR